MMGIDNSDDTFKISYMTGKNLYQRIAAVIAESGAVAKTGTFAGQGNWQFHSIDHVVEHLRPLLVKHGLVMLPSELAAHPESDGKINSHYQTLGLTIVNVDNPEERETIQASALGMDYSDKAAGKSFSYALKTLLLGVFCLRGQPDLDDQDIQREDFIPPTPEQIQRMTELRDDVTAPISISAYMRQVLEQREINTAEAALILEKAEKALIADRATPAF